ncbi:hypothetical protein TIFTF001_024669 [Ficus carica]|uniref:Uncharacterized protein n=1 Tax=Ficus carica TaxID=3494 RepID=A0AA88AID1_FICCA|nr:hypothetical protein TIFTF001_024669 [Ficus carica]
MLAGAMALGVCSCGSQVENERIPSWGLYYGNADTGYTLLDDQGQPNKVRTLARTHPLQILTPTLAMILDDEGIINLGWTIERN